MNIITTEALWLDTESESKESMLINELMLLYESFLKIFKELDSEASFKFMEEILASLRHFLLLFQEK